MVKPMRAFLFGSPERGGELLGQCFRQSSNDRALQSILEARIEVEQRAEAFNFIALFRNHIVARQIANRLIQASYGQ